jgi:transglutaminase-like putative cysteine protease
MRRAPAVLLAGAAAVFASTLPACSRETAALAQAAASATPAESVAAQPAGAVLAASNLAAAPAPLPPASAHPKQQVSVLDLPRPREPIWFGVYLMGKKAGYSRTWVGLETREGRRVLVTREEVTVSVTVGTGTVKRWRLDEKVYQARPGGRLVSFTSRQAGDGGDRTTEGRCTVRGCTVQLLAQGQREERKVGPVNETAEQADAARLAWARQGIVSGEQLELETLEVKKVEDRYAGTARVAAGGVESQVARVEELKADDRVAAKVSFAPDGRLLEYRIGDGVVMRAEPEETAKRLDKVDLLAMARVKLPRPLARNVPGSVVMKLRGVPKEFQSPDPRQSWASGPDGAVTLTVVARQPRAADPAHDAPRTRGAAKGTDELLASTPEIDSDSPDIAKLAREVVGDTRGVYAASVKIAHFVNHRLEKAYGVSRDRASEVLALGKGDCTEHALLFTALARAAGIPARQVHGLVFARYDDGVPALYWHAWVEVKSGEEWIALDPTFDQPVADPTHVVLGRGTQVDTVGLLGALEVVSAEERPAG